MEAATFTVPSGHHGHPGLAFGGYVAGILTSGLSGSAKVDFRRPTPVGTELHLTVDGYRVELRQDLDVLATAEPSSIDIRIPRVPTWSEALAGVGTYLVDTHIEVDSCFGCGPGRSPGEGLRIFPGVATGEDLVVAAWRPSVIFADPDDASFLARPYVWAALDCPGGWARKELSRATTDRAVTAYLAAELVGPVILGEPHVVVGWPISRDGRKARVGSAIFSVDGDLCAFAEALWIDLPD